MVEEYQSRIRSAAQAVQDACADVIAEVRGRLGDTVSPGDYPADLARCYGLEVAYPNLGPRGDLPPAALEQERDRLQARIAEAARLAHATFLQGFADLASHLAECLESGKVFRDSAVENLRASPAGSPECPRLRG
jgi:hypothetical protein